LQGRTITATHFALIYADGTVDIAKTGKGQAPMQGFAALLSKVLHGECGLFY
jgi:hypothetical protein